MLNWFNILPNSSGNEQPEPVITTSAETKQRVFENNKPVQGYNAYRNMGLANMNNGYVFMSAAAFKDGTSADGHASDGILVISKDGMKTWQAVKIILNNGIVSESRIIPEMMVVDRNTDTLHLFYSAIDTNGNMVEIVPPPAYGVWKYDLLQISTSDYGETFTNPKSVKYAFDNRMPNTILQALIAVGSGIQTKNGNLVCPSYYGWHDGSVYRWYPALFYSTDNAQTWQISDITGDPSNESSVVELTDNEVMVVARKGNLLSRNVTSNFEDFTPHVSDKWVQCHDCESREIKLPKEQTGFEKDLFLRSQVSIRNRSRIAIFGTTDPDLKQWVEVYEIEDFGSEESFGYSHIQYYGNILACTWEGLKTAEPTPVSAVNLIEFLPQFYADSDNYQDNTAPVITSFTVASASSNVINLNVTATDNVLAVLFRVYQNGVYRKQVAGDGKATLTMPGLDPNTSYDFYVTVEDAGGNVSAQSQTITASTTA